MGSSKRSGLLSLSMMLPALRFRAKIILGFAVVLAISAASMGFAYLGFENVSAGVASYRNSVSEADLARNIDRELISYRSLARYYVVTGKDEDAKAALKAQADLKQAIDQSINGTRMRPGSRASSTSPVNSTVSHRPLPTFSRSSARVRWWCKTSSPAAATC